MKEDKGSNDLADTQFRDRGSISLSCSSRWGISSVQSSLLKMTADTCPL